MGRSIERVEHAAVRYPWRQWTDGRAWRVKQGKDFGCSVAGFRNALYMHAARAQAKVRVSVKKGAVVEFQFSDGSTKASPKEDRL